LRKKILFNFFFQDKFKITDSNIYNRLIFMLFINLWCIVPICFFLNANFFLNFLDDLFANKKESSIFAGLLRKELVR